MRIIVLTLVLLSVIVTGCDNPVNQKPANNSNLEISFKNNSAFVLKNVLVANMYIGNIDGGSSTVYIPFEKFTFDTGMPDENASAIVNGNVITNHYRGYWCGTEKITIDSGRYLIEVEIVDTVLYLSCKNAPVIEYP